MKTDTEKEIREFQRSYRAAKKRVPIGAVLTTILGAFTIWTWGGPARWWSAVPFAVFALVLAGDAITVFHSRANLRRLGGEIPER